MAVKDAKPKRHGVSRRVGDEERHKTAELLSEHHAHGRLTQEEFEDRLGAALTAQTTAELGRLLADLPLRAPDEDEQDEKAPVPARAKRRLVVELDLRMLRAPIVIAAAGSVCAYLGAVVSPSDMEQGVGAALLGMGVGMLATPLMRRRKRKDG